MRSRITALLASSSLVLNVTAAPLHAQPAPPQGAQASDQQAPALAGRLTGIRGSVSYHAAGETQWSPAANNFTVTAGYSFWTEPQAQATIEIADDHVVMDGSTELDIQTLDQGQAVFVEPQGAVFLDLPSVPDGQGLTIDTPRAAVQITQPGRYEIVAGDTDHATLVSVVQGQAHATANGLDVTVGANQTATITGADTFQGSTGPLQQDQFLSEMLSRNAPASPPPQGQAQGPAPAVVSHMTGYQDLAQYGSWQQSSDYGQVWYPNDVGSDWAPYREGHWAYVSPWGWTWVDDEPWGFAPFHYGRWVQTGGRWGWVAVVPGEPVEPYPVYSPAMVSFVDVAGAALAGAALGFAAGALVGGAIGWVPLAPREPFYPWYRTGPGYFARVNAGYGVPRTIISRGPTYITNVNVRNVYINRGAATVAPANAIIRGERLRGVARPLPERVLAQSRIVVDRQPVRPTAETPQLRANVRREYDIRATRPAGNTAPGPRITPAADRGPAGRPALRPNALPPNVRPVPAAGANRPGEPNRPNAPGPNGNRPGEPNRPNAPGPNAGRPGGPEANRPNAPGARPGMPALRPPGAGRPPAEATGPGAPRPNEPGRPGPDNRPGTPGARPGGETRPAAPGPRPGADTRPGAPGARPGTDNRPGAPGPRPGSGPENRPGGLPSLRPEGTAPPGAPRPENRPASRPEAAPRPETRPAPRPEAPPRPENRPAPRPEATRPAPRPEAARPAPRPEAPPRPAPRPEAPPRPIPRPAAPEIRRPEPPRPPAAVRPPPPRPEPRPAPAREGGAPKKPGDQH